MAKKKVINKAPEYPKVIETFYQVGDYEIGRMTDKKPSCFNMRVNFRKYRVTIELVDEPIGVLQERLEKLWVENDNHHNWEPLEQAAKSIGYKFKGQHGSQKK